MNLACSCATWSALATLAACSGDSSSDGGGSGSVTTTQSAANSSGSGMVTELFPNATPFPGQSECRVKIVRDLPSDGQKHMPSCMALSYTTNPPTSGDHWGVWAAYGTYQSAIPKGMLVHNLEHGGLVMGYRCDGDCATEVLAALTNTADAIGVDPVCTAQTGGKVRNRVIIAPDDELEAPLAIAAWRAYYVATCLDPASLEAFAQEHYAKGPENVCADGKDPLTVCAN